MRRALVVVALLALVVPALAHAKPDPVTWCGGADETPADRLPDVEAAAPEQIRFVYVLPAGEPDHFPQYASGIATDAAWIDQWWRAQDPTRTPRFDRYPFPNCTSTYGALDIGVKRLPLPASSYLVPDTPAEEIAVGLGGLFSASEKTIVYFDGPINSKNTCGESNLSESRGGDFGIAYVYLQSGCNLGVPGAGKTAEVAAHELLHNLGAVPSDAPNECPTSAAHACDSTTDVMYPYVSDGSTLDSVVLDLNRDDYYGHSGAWFDVQDSTWLTHLPEFPYSLAVVGAGTLVSTLPCDTGCSIQVDNGEEISVNAVPKPGWKFQSWSNACGSAPICNFAISGATSATATFVRAPLRVTVTVAGNGRVMSSPAGISCPGACDKTLTSTSARLVAHPAAGWRFTGWSGACRGKGVCTVHSAASVRAHFTRR